MTTRADRQSAERGEEGLLVNALVGAVVSVVLAFVPFSPVLGGGVAGYLQRGDERTGLKVGAISGAIASIPVLGILVLLFAFLSIVTIVPDAPGPGLGIPLFFGLLLLAAASFVLLFVIALSAVGGYVGAAIARERGRSPATRPPVRAGSAGRESAETTDAGSVEAAESDSAETTDTDPAGAADTGPAEAGETEPEEPRNGPVGTTNDPDDR